MRTQFIFSLFILSFKTLAVAAEFTNEKCSHVLMGSGEIQINRQWIPDSETCFIDIHPRNPVDLKYRDYYFDNRGEFMVFNSYGNGPPSAFAATREFFLFPITQDYPDFAIESNGDVTVKLVSGHLFRISAEDFSIVSITPGTFTEKALSKNNQGGVEINLTKGFWIDGGFKMGGSRMSNPKVSSIVKSSLSKNTSCGVLNKDLLNYQDEYNFVFKYEKENLISFLKTKCPKLKF